MLSVSTMVKRGLIITLTEKFCQIYEEYDCRIQGDVKVTAREEGGVHRLNQFTVERANAAIERTSKELWRRLFATEWPLKLNYPKKMCCNLCPFQKENIQGSPSRNLEHKELSKCCSSYIQICADP